MSARERGGGSDDERARWNARYATERTPPVGAASEWVIRQAREAGARALIVDLACGRGRHAVALAEGRVKREGRRVSNGRGEAADVDAPSPGLVIAVDLAEAAVRPLRDAAVARALPIGAVVADAHALPLREACADVVLCVSFLDRALFPHLHRLLRAGGRLIIETYTVDQRTLGAGPTSAAHLLERGELPTLVGPLTVVAQREELVRDDAGERYVASVVAVNSRGKRGGKASASRMGSGSPSSSPDNPANFSS